MAEVTSAATAAEAESLPWVEKYRPNHLSDLCSHEEIISTLNKLMEGGHLPNLLFYGPPGTGKTSTVLACAKQMYGGNINSMVLELNASDDRCDCVAFPGASLFRALTPARCAAASMSCGSKFSPLLVRG